MNENAWLANDDVGRMLHALPGRPSNRKLLLFACACCRRHWPTLHARSRKAVEVVEAYADLDATDEDVARAFLDARAVSHQGDGANAAMHAVAHPAGEYASLAGAVCQVVYYCARAAAATAFPRPSLHAQMSSPRTLVGNEDAATLGYVAAREAEKVRLAGLLREVLGFPFCPKHVRQQWLAANGQAVLRIADDIYTGRAFEELPILADALEDAGCADADLLGHLRSPGPHVRGCWALDLILGR